MTCPGTAQALQAAQENPRCLRCDRIIPEYHKGDPLDCGCEYAIKPSPLSSVEVVVVTEDEDAMGILRSLGARYARAHGWFITPHRSQLFEMLWKAEAVFAGRGKYRFPDGTLKDIYSSMRHLRAK